MQNKITRVFFTQRRTFALNAFSYKTLGALCERKLTKTTNNIFDS